MTLNITYKHMDSSESLTSYIEDKLEKPFARFFDDGINAKVSIEKDHQNFVAKLHFFSHGQSIDLKSEEKDAYETIDSLADKLERSSRKSKEKELSKRSEKLDPLEKNPEEVE